MYCKRCGTELRENDTFCYHCGNRTTIIQRIFSSKAIIGSIIALLLVLIVGIMTFFILTGKIKFPEKGKEPAAENVSETEDAPIVTPTPIPTPTPFVFSPMDVTSQAKIEMKDMLSRLKPFLGYSASYYANGSHKFKWDDKVATVLALYNVEHYDKIVKYGDDADKFKKAAKKEMTKLFGSKYKYKFEYGGTYPSYVYRPIGNTLVFNSSRITGKDYSMQVKKVVEYEQSRYRIVADACLKTVANGQKGVAQRYTIFVEKKPDSKFGYVVTEIRLSKKKDMNIG